MTPVRDGVVRSRVTFGVCLGVKFIRFPDRLFIPDENLLGDCEVNGVRTFRLIDGVRFVCRVGCLSEGRCVEWDFIELPKLRLIDELPPRDEDLLPKLNLLPASETFMLIAPHMATTKRQESVLRNIVILH
jgi:hypothetical protein